MGAIVVESVFGCAYQRTCALLIQNELSHSTMAQTAPKINAYNAQIRFFFIMPLRLCDRCAAGHYETNANVLFKVAYFVVFVCKLAEIECFGIFCFCLSHNFNPRRICHKMLERNEPRRVSK